MNFDQKIATYRELKIQEQYRTMYELQIHDYQHIPAHPFSGVSARLSCLHPSSIPKRRNVEDIVTIVPAPTTSPESSSRSTIKGDNSYVSTK